MPAVEVRGALEVQPGGDRIKATGRAPSWAPPVMTVNRSDPAPMMPEGFHRGARIIPWLGKIWLAGVLVQSEPRAAGRAVGLAVAGPRPGHGPNVNGLATEYEGTNHSFSLGETTTDAQGRWHMDVAPKDVSGVWVSVEDPRYQQGAGERVVALGRESVFILKKGLTVTGKVVDAADRPVRAAKALSVTTVLTFSLRLGRRTSGASSPWNTAPQAQSLSRSRPRGSRPRSPTSGLRSGPHRSRSD
jgi:hypothetical protein